MKSSKDKNTEGLKQEILDLIEGAERLSFEDLSKIN